MLSAVWYNSQMHFVLLALCIGLLSCSHSRIERYRDALDSQLGNGKKTSLDQLLGMPYLCKNIGVFERCEYRTASQRNHPVPIVYRKAPGFGPDLSPYDYFDVIYLYYDDFDVLQEWEPVVIW